MAEAETLTNLTPKQLGRHLRAVRRNKGLSLSEVARGAGLTRREMNAYEKGRVPVSESDLFVIAGACGVEVSELRPPVGAPALAEPTNYNGNGTPRVESGLLPSGIQDVVTRLRRGHDDTVPGRPALEHAPYRAIEAPDASDELEAFASLPDRGPAEPVDVFAELARLPEPLPLPATGEPPDLFAPRLEDTLPPFGAIEEVDDMPWDDWAAGEASGAHEVASDEGDGRPVLVELPATAAPDLPPDPSDAPPIDVAARVDRFELGWPWDGATAPDGGGPNTDDVMAGAGPVDSSADAWAPDETAEPTAVEETWPDRTWPDETPPHGVWPDEAAPDPAATSADPPPPSPADEWPAPPEAATGEALAAWEHEPDPAATSSGFFVDWGERDSAGAGSSLDAIASTDPWSDATPAVERVPVTGTAPETADGEHGERDEPGAAPSPFGEIPDWVTEVLSEPVDDEDDDAGVDAGVDAGIEAVPPAEDPPFISWHPLDDNPGATTPGQQEPAATAVATMAGPEPLWDAAFPAVPPTVTPAGWATPADEPAAARPAPDEPAADESAISEHGIDGQGFSEQATSEHGVSERGTDGQCTDGQFVVAGSEWQLGNAVPLVEVRSSGSLVMRRADERWALADVTTPGSFVVEAFVDLRSGPGFGVLFRASVDGDGRMSGYSFDLDPVYDGGSFLVREWRADRELWNPIAHVPMTDPGELHGLLSVRLTVDGERLEAAVNGSIVLTVDDLGQASSDRGREGATGDRVGIQAWSSTDLVIDAIRVARR